MRDAGYSRLLVDVPFFCFYFSYLVLPQVTDPAEPGGCRIAMRPCRHRPWLFPWLLPAFCCYFLFRLHRPLTKTINFSIFFQVCLIWIFDGAHDVMLATAIEHSATQCPSPGTGCGFFCMYSRVLIVKIPILFGPGWQSVRLWDFRRCDALPGFSAGRGGGEESGRNWTQTIFLCSWASGGARTNGKDTIM